MSIPTIVRRIALLALPWAHQSASAQFGFSGEPDRASEYLAIPWAVLLVLAVGICFVNQAQRRKAFSAIKVALLAYAALETTLILCGITLCVSFGRESEACLAPVLFALMGFMFSGAVLLSLLPLVALIQAFVRAYGQRQ